jgi:hypothetical protein
MKVLHQITWLAVLLAAMLPLACGGSGGGSLTAGGGIDGSGIISQGPITSYGSIVVNGTEFDTTQADVIVDDELVGTGDQAVRDHLKIGMVVTAEGRGSANETDLVAERVIYHESLHGPVADIRSIDAVTKVVSVLGQEVCINGVTKFQDTSFESLALDDVISVSGLFDDQGVIWATFLQRTGSVVTGETYEVTGSVTNLDTTLASFQINGLQVDYAQAVFVDLLPEDLTEGLRIEVEGTLDADNDTLQATTILPGDALDDEDADVIEVVGFVTSRVAIDEFTVGSQVVQIASDAVFVDGTPDDLVLGAKVEASGRLEGGILKADEIEFWGLNQIELEGLITDFVSASEFTLGSQAVRTDAHTVFDNCTAEDLGRGVWIEVKGVPVDIGRTILLADKVSFEED